MDELKLQTGADGAPADGAKGKRTLTEDEKIIVLMRRCGHHLHHIAKNADDAQQMIATLSERERHALYVLLKKVYSTFRQDTTK